MTMKTIYLAVAAMLATAALTVQGDPYATNSCPSEDNTNADLDFIQCIPVQGPASLDVKPFFGVGLGACTGPELRGANAFPCFQAGATNVGAAIYPNDGWGGAGNRSVSIWAGFGEGIFPQIGSHGVGGFSMLVCNDRDFDSTCTNINDNSDQLRDAYSNQAQGASAPCPDDKKNKDDKDCAEPDPTDAEVVDFCMVPAEAPLAPWNDGQVIVFIGAWVAVDPFDPNVGAGLSSGTYDVWLEINATIADHDGDPLTPDEPVYTPCRPPDCDDRLDNDGDGAVDFDDLECNDYDDFSERPECSDTVDNNDADGDADFPADLDCSSPADDTEKGLAEWLPVLVPSPIPPGIVAIQSDATSPTGARLTFVSPGWVCNVAVGGAVASGVPVSCVPTVRRPAGPWTCFQTAVMTAGEVTVGAVTGTSSCGTLSSSATIMPGTTAAADTDPDPAGQPIPVRCTADFAGAVTSGWRVLCGRHAPDP